MIIPRTPSRPRSLLSMVAAIGVGVGILGQPSPAVADVDEPDADAVVELSLSLGEHGAIAADTPVTGTATLENAPEAELSAGVLSIEIDRTALVDMTAVDAWLARDRAAGAFSTVFSAPTEQVDPDAAEEIPFTIPVTALAGLGPGVYPVRATVTGMAVDDDSPHELTARSVLTVRAAAEPTVGVLVPITATPTSGDLLSAEELEAMTAPDGALTAQLDAVVGTAATLAVDPAIPAAIRVLGPAAPETAVAWLSRLEALPNETFALQFGDADPATQAQAGLDALLTPTTLDVFRASEEPAPTPSPSPSPTVASPTEPDPGELDDPTAIDGALDGLLWPRDGVTPADLTTFDAYVDTATTILPSTAIDGATGAHARIGDADVLVTDADISDLLSAAAAEDDATVRDLTLAKASAALHFAGAPASGILIGLDRDETRTRDALQDVIEATRAVALHNIRDTAPTEAGLLTPPESTRAADLKMLLNDEERLAAFSSILEDPQVLLAPERIRVLRLLAVGLEDDAFAEAYRAHRERTESTLDAVGIQDYSGPIQLFSANVDLPVWIRNDLPWPVTLTLQVQPSDPRIDVEPFTRIEAVATSNAKVQIPVAARIASGELRVGFSLESPTGVPIGAPQTAEVTVRAEWEGIGLAILGAVIVLLLGFGVLRTVRRRRAEAASASGEPVDASDDLTEAASAADDQPEASRSDQPEASRNEDS